MKRFLAATLIFLGLCIALFACHKNTDRTTVEIGPNPTWPVEAFKNDYTIQFPGTYSGQMNGYEGNIFYKSKVLNTDYFAYSYCGLFHCEDFGETLTNPNQAFIEVPSNTGGMASILLSYRVDFTSNGVLVGIFFHNNEQLSTGRLFWKDNGFFKEAADTHFKKQDLAEIIGIIKTIKTR